MAEVFLARRRAAGVEKLLVVKRIRPERAGDPRFFDLFVREAKLSMSLTHQNIVPVFDFGRAGDQVFLAMERVEGKDLGSTLSHSERRPPPPLVAAFIAAECCQALDYAHGRRRPDGNSLGIVHRDVSPRNVLLSWSGEVKLTDFGIATLAGEDTSRLVGTPGYMAPEQARGETLDGRTDVYAAGMVLREALTGARARAGEDREALLAAARSGALAPWEGAPPPELVRVADRATAERPDDRYASAHEMLVDLDAYIVAERAANRGDPPARQLATWLASVWGPDHEATAGDDRLQSGDSAELLSFLEDGPFDAIGTGTEHSLAATAADDEPQVDAGSEPPSTAASGATKTAPVLELKKPNRQTSRRRILAAPLGVAAVSILFAVIAVRMRRGPDPGADFVAPVDATAIGPAIPGSGSAGGSAGRSTGSADEVSAGSGSDEVAGSGSDEVAGSGSDDIASAVDPGPGSAAIVRPPRNPIRPPRSGSGSGSGNPVRVGVGSARSGSGSDAGSGVATPTVLRKVHINATPWAYFTVDGGQRYQTPKLLELAPGKHVIHFENAILKVARDITLDVPVDRDISYVEPLGR